MSSSINRFGSFDQTGGAGKLPPSSSVPVGDGELLIRAAGQIIGGWTGISVSRSVEGIPGTFTISASVRFPGEPRSPIPNNAPLQVLIGGKVVLTGYLERIVVALSAERHEVRLTGRGRCCDLVDCAALLGSNSISGASIGELARQLVKPFAGPISVLTPDGDGDKKNYNFVINLSESPYEILERVGRYEGLLQYENADGNLVLSRVGTAKHASGFTEGANIQSVEVYDTRDERFSTYIPQLMSADTMAQVGSGGNDAGKPTADPGIDRYRPKIIISEQATSGGFLAEQRARWEALRRIGRSMRVELVCDSWLDSAGMPWTPNMLAPVSVPSLGLAEAGLVIVEVTYSRNGQSGTTATLVLMPADALTIEPSALMGLVARNEKPGPASPESPLGTPTPAVPPRTAPNSFDPGSTPRGDH